jgi:hypothetical protein
MTPEHQAYVKALRARHQSDRATLRAAVEAVRPGLLRELKRLHFEVERETRNVLERLERPA